MRRLSIFFCAICLISSCNKEEGIPSSSADVIEAPEQELTTTPQYVLAVTAEEGGTISTEGGTYDQDTVITITANANEGYVFTGWEGSESTSTTIEISMVDNINIRATFETITNLREGIVESIISDNYQTYLDAFINEALLYNIDLSYVLEGEVTFYEDESPVAGWACWAWGRGRDSVLHVGINPDMFYDETVTDYGRMWLMYHEFGHDIFNYRHRDPPVEDNGDMMNPASKRDSSLEEFMVVADKMFERYRSEN